MSVISLNQQIWWLSQLSVVYLYQIPVSDIPLLISERQNSLESPFPCQIWNYVFLEIFTFFYKSGNQVI